MVQTFHPFLFYSRLVTFFVHESAARESHGASYAIFQKKLKVVKMLIIIAVLFVISWLPYFIMLCIQVSTGAQGIHFLTLILVSILLQYSRLNKKLL